MTWLEPTLTALILAVAVAWAVRRFWRSVRRRVAADQPQDGCAPGASAACGCDHCPAGTRSSCDPTGEPRRGPEARP